MGISIIRGAISSGKSRMCLEQIEKLHAEKIDARCIMIVPDHYSYETEKMFVEHFGGTGLNNIEVLTLRRMALNILSASQLNHLTPSGKQMLIYKAVTDACAELRESPNADGRLINAMGRRGFTDVASSLISEMNRYLIPPAAIGECADKISGNKTLKNKLAAFSLIYERYTAAVERSGCTDSDSDLFRLAEKIETGDEFDENTYVWINRFDKFMPQQLCVIEALLKKGAHITVSICCPAENDELYAYTRRTVDDITRLAAVYGFDGEFTAGEGLSGVREREDLYALLSNWNEDFVYDKVPQNIAMFRSRDPYGEVERIACKISDLVRDEGCRYRDIAVLCGREAEYAHLIEAVFGEYEIPYFTDKQIILSDHPIAMQIISLFGILEEDWSYESVMRYLRAGFIYRKTKKGAYSSYEPIDGEEIDAIENLVLKYGIRGSRRWLDGERWQSCGSIIAAAFGEEEENTAAERLEALRAEIAAPIVKFSAAVKGKKTPLEFAEALFEYLNDINLYAGLHSDASRLKKQGKLNESEQLTKIWNLILDVLDQTVTALGDEKMKADEFARYVQEGLSKSEIRTIPSGIDQVYVGSVERSSHTGVKIMFAAGCVNGTFPTAVTDEGFFSNRDRDALRENGISIAPDTKKKTDEMYFKTYRALCAVSERLYLSYSMQNSEGGTASPSHMVLDICRKFPKMRISDTLTDSLSGDAVYISAPKPTVHRMLINISSRHNGSNNPIWDAVRGWYEKNGDSKRISYLMRSADYYNRRGIMLDGDIANILYEGKITYSASRINTFFACPFQYFMKYGLGAKPREEWELSPADMGSFAHRVINDFCIEVEDGAKTPEEKIGAWRSLTDEKQQEILTGIIDTARERLLQSEIHGRDRAADIFARMGRTVSDAASLVRESLSAGGFAEEGMELKFETELTDNARLAGIIDRLDVCRDGDKTYIRIIDYKTGSTKFDEVNIYNGYDMQPVLYALAASRLIGGGAKVTGIYYTPVKSEYAEIKLGGGEDFEASRQLDGVTFAPEGDKETERVIYNIDNRFFENHKSSFTKIKLDAKGNIKGVGSLDEINGLMARAAENTADMDERTRAGDISLNPYNSRGKTPICAYCDYSGVCAFDSGRRAAREPEGTKETIREKMEIKGAALRGGKAE